MIITRISSLSTIAKVIAFGDLFISLDTVRTMQEQFEQPYDRELHRVIIHGILHLCGINDKGPGRTGDYGSCREQGAGHWFPYNRTYKGRTTYKVTGIVRTNDCP